MVKLMSSSTEPRVSLECSESTRESLIYDFLMSRQQFRGKVSKILYFRGGDDGW